MKPTSWTTLWGHKPHLWTTLVDAILAITLTILGTYLFIITLDWWLP